MLLQCAKILKANYFVLLSLSTKNYTTELMVHNIKVHKKPLKF